MKVTCKYCGYKFKTDKFWLNSGSDINCPRCGHCMQEPLLTDLADDIENDGSLPDNIKSFIIAKNTVINLQRDISNDHDNDDTICYDDEGIEPMDKLNALFDDIIDDIDYDDDCIWPIDDIEDLFEDISDDSVKNNNESKKKGSICVFNLSYLPKLWS